MTLSLVQTTRFRRDIRQITRSRKNIESLEIVVRKLADGEPLPPKNRDHSLIGDWKGYRECHIAPDWLLVYKVQDHELILARTGSHSELFG